ncbi:NAD(P)-dependent oxidoreductase [Sphingomicrobium sp. XHP0239]|uniref:NAD-dependent epimerase/dehydratase family protein n=1 Tax=Sphingomicrobium maritimum TaxID=3133972 RepID=UPI0031CCB058
MAERGTVALTGATGFVGRRLVRALAERGTPMRFLVRHPAADLPAEGERVVCDLDADTPVSPDLFEGCDAFVHLAARLPARAGEIEEAEQCWRVNALGTLRLVDAAIAAGVHRIVQTGSANAYRHTLDRADEEAPLEAGTRGAYYLASKIAQESYAAARVAQSDAALVTLRLSSVYGAGEGGGLLRTMARRLLAGEPVEMVNGGRFAADFVHVDDVVTALLLALDGRVVGPVNVASGERRTLREAIDLLVGATGADPALVEAVTRDDDPPGLPGIDIARARSLGFDPRGLDAGIERLVSALRS